MTIDTLRDQLDAAGVIVTVEGADLRVAAPRGALTAELRTLIAASKPDLIALLSPLPAGPGPNSRLAVGVERESVWWPDLVPEKTVAITIIPPAGCVGPMACSRLGECPRNQEGNPCQS